MRKILFVCFSLLLIVLFLVQSSFSQKISWQTIQSGVTNSIITLTKDNANSLWGAGNNGTIIKSTDGGLTWNKININSKTDFWRIFFIDSLNGWVGGQKSQIGSPTDFLYTTKDGGLTCSVQNISAKGLITGIDFLNRDTGYVCDNGGNVFKTIDGGSNWLNIFTNSISLSDIRFFDSNNGIVIGYYGLALKTSDGGTHWNTLNIGTSTWLYKLFCIDENNYWAVGDSCRVIYTNNAGNTWDTCSFSSTDALYGVRFWNKSKGIICGGGWFTGGSVYYTSDSGVSWEKQSLPNNKLIMDIIFIDGNKCIAAGNDGTIFHGDISTDVLEKGLNNSKILLFPNPTTREINISYFLNSIGNVIISIYDVLGYKVQSISLGQRAHGQNIEKIVVNDLPMGIYYLKVDKGTGNEIFKFIIAHL